MPPRKRVRMTAEQMEAKMKNDVARLFRTHLGVEFTRRDVYENIKAVIGGKLTRGQGAGLSKKINRCLRLLRQEGVIMKTTSGKYVRRLPPKMKKLDDVNIPPGSFLLKSMSSDLIIELATSMIKESFRGLMDEDNEIVYTISKVGNVTSVTCKDKSGRGATITLEVHG